MKKILLILMLAPFVASSQVKQDYNQYGGRWYRLALRDSGAFQLPRKTMGIKDQNLGLDTAQLYYDKTDSTVKVYTGYQWRNIGAGLGGGITALTGDVTATGPGSVAATLATVNGNVGSFSYGSFTVNAKGLITAASSGATPLTAVPTFQQTLTAGANITSPVNSSLGTNAFTLGSGQTSTLYLDPVGGLSMLGDVNGAGSINYVSVDDNNSDIRLNTDTLKITDASLAGASVGHVWGLKNTTTGAGGWTTSTTGTVTGTGTDNYIPRWNGTTALENSQIFDDGTNVGIGTATPTNLLDVVKNQASPTRINIENTDAAGTTTLRFTNSAGAASSLSHNNATKQVTLQNAITGGSLRLQTTGGGITTTALTVDSTQNVGIGLTAGTGIKLDVALSDVNLLVRAGSDGVQGAGLTYGFQSYSNLGAIQFGADRYFNTLGVGLVSATLPGGIVFSGNNNNQHLNILSSGNVGIGVTVPTAVLHLKASTTAASTGQIKLAEGSRQTTPEDGTVNYVANNLEFVETSTVYTLAKTLTATGTLDFGNTLAGTVSDLTITVTGAADGDAVTIGVPNGSYPATGTFTAWVSAANTVTIRYANNSLTLAQDPASGTFRAAVIKY